MYSDLALTLMLDVHNKHIQVQKMNQQFGSYLNKHINIAKTILLSSLLIHNVLRDSQSDKKNRIRT